MTTFQPYTDIIGTPQPGEYVPPTQRAAEHLIAGGWTPPQPVPTDAQIIGPSRNAWDDKGWGA